MILRLHFILSKHLPYLPTGTNYDNNENKKEGEKEEVHGLAASTSILWSKIKQSLQNSFTENPTQIDTEFSNLFNSDINVKNEKQSTLSVESTDPKKVKINFITLTFIVVLFILFVTYLILSNLICHFLYAFCV